MPSDPAESEWSDLEQDKMLALAHYEALLCPLCGGPMSVCTDPANEGKFKTDPPTRCHKTTSAAAARDDFDQRKHSQALLLSTHLSKPAS